MVKFLTEEKVVALKKNRPVNGYAHRQFGLGVRPEPQEGGVQLFHGVKLDVEVTVGTTQNPFEAPDSAHIGLSTSLFET